MTYLWAARSPFTAPQFRMKNMCSPFWTLGKLLQIPNNPNLFGSQARSCATKSLRPVGMDCGSDCLGHRGKLLMKSCEHEVPIDIIETTCDGKDWDWVDTLDTPHFWMNCKPSCGIIVALQCFPMASIPEDNGSVGTTICIGRTCSHRVD